MKTNCLDPHFIYKTDEETDKGPLDEDEVFKKLPPRKQWIYNEMVEFQKELRQHGLAGSLHRVIHMPSKRR